jgi:deoxyribose-phosphate aldolase
MKGFDSHFLFSFFAVCVNGSRVETAVDVCKGSNVAVVGVVGFPLGASTLNSKINEAVHFQSFILVFLSQRIRVQ